MMAGGLRLLEGEGAGRGRSGSETGAMPARNGADVGAYGGGTDCGVHDGATMGNADVIGCSGLAIAFAR
jgi:hypothetical protein